MKVGIDCRMYRSSVAGIGRYSQNLVKNLLEIDQKDEFILFMTSADAKEYQKSNIKNQNDKVKIKIIDIAHFSLAEQINLPKIIAKENLDLMHFLNFNYPVRYKGKFVSVIHDLTLYFHPETAKDTNIYKMLAYKYAMKKACQNAIKIIAVSESTKRDIIKVFKIPENKIRVIYEAADDPARKVFSNGTSKEQIQKIKEQYHISMPVILSVGQFRKHKNLIGLIKAFNIVRSKMPAKLVLLGRADLDFEFKKMLDKSEYKEDIIMPGFVSDEDLSAWYKIASVFVFPSFYEGFGLPGLEAMMAGVPVVASNKSSLPEIYRDGAIYFDPFDVSEIADKIKEVLTNKNLSQHLIENGKRVAKEYSWKKTALDTLEVYREVRNTKS